MVIIMALRKILTDSDPLLRKTSRPIASVTPRISILLDDMYETLENAEGVGLAAPQVGVLKRAVVIKLPEQETIYEMINPRIIQTIGTQCKSEACLSIPDKTGFVERPEQVTVVYTDRKGQEFKLVGEGLLAIAISHEVDHLDGILFVDKLADPQPEEEE